MGHRAVNKVKSTAAALVAASTVGWFIDDTPTGPGLGEYQQRCAQALAFFVTQVPLIEPRGKYQVTYGEFFRPISVARSYGQQGIGISNSLHTKRLAVDLNLFVDGKFATDSEAHRPLAELWLQTGAPFGVVPTAGVYFAKPDGNHYSCAYQGVK